MVDIIIGTELKPVWKIGQNDVEVAAQCKASLSSMGVGCLADRM